MRESHKKLNSIINQLVSWAKDYPGESITSSQQQRITNLMGKIKSSQIIPPTELIPINTPKVENSTTIKPKPDAIYVVSKNNKKVIRYSKCKGCNNLISQKNELKHKLKCPKLLQQANPPEIEKKFSKESSKWKEQLQFHKEKMEENRLDGGRYYYQRRENNRFGSYPLHDSYDEESSS